jgi:hypothetical protein
VIAFDGAHAPLNEKLHDSTIYSFKKQFGIVTYALRLQIAEDA